MGHSFVELVEQIIYPAVKTTLYMVTIATIFSAIFGFMIAILLYVTRKSGLHPNRGDKSLWSFQYSNYILGSYKRILSAFSTKSYVGYDFYSWIFSDGGCCGSRRIRLGCIDVWISEF